MDNNSLQENEVEPSFVNINQTENKYISQQQNNEHVYQHSGYNQQQFNPFQQYTQFNAIKHIPMQSHTQQQFIPENTHQQIQQQINNQNIHINSYLPSLTHSNNITYQQPTDVNGALNSRIFNNDYVIQGSLVPVNKQHMFSRNLFQEGTPIPYDLQQQQTVMKQPHNPKDNINNPYNYYNGHQFRNKTLYKDQLNNRLQSLSPLGDRLFMPSDNQQQQQQQGQQHFYHPNSQSYLHSNLKGVNYQNNYRGDKREEMNARMSQYEPLPSIITGNTKNHDIVIGVEPPQPSL